MTHYQSKKWQLFVSRPTSILKRDFMKWTYLALDRIKEVKLTKLLTIGNNKEMDIFVDGREDRKNYLAVIKQCQTGKTARIFIKYQKLIKNYQPHGKNLVEQSLNAMKEVGAMIIYTYYVERWLGEKGNGGKKEMIQATCQLRDGGAKIIYPLYDQARDCLQKKFVSKKVDNYSLQELRKNSFRIETRQRGEFYVFLGTKKRTIIYIGQQAEKFLQAENFVVVKNKKAKELKGFIASPGKIKGIVKIVRNLDNIKNCAGKIVVSQDTIIEYTSYLKKALAIVTDLGGVSCHTAIIAREFKIPCIINTKIATEVFKDGDLVEVNANDGIVRKIK